MDIFGEKMTKIFIQGYREQSEASKSVFNKILRVADRSLSSSEILEEKKS